MIRKLAIENFKSLRKTDELRIAPITFLVGPNSSGKSSLLQALLMLKQTVDGRDMFNPLLINGPYVNLGTYPDFIFAHTTGDFFKVSLEFDARKRPQTFGAIGRKLGEKVNLESTFRYNKSKMLVQLEESLISSIPSIPNINVLCIKRGKRDSYGLRGERVEDNGEIKKDNFASIRPIKFYGFQHRGPTTKKLRPYEMIGYMIQREIESFFEKFFYIGPLRAWPKRFYVAAGEAPQDVGFSGEFGIDVLLACRYSKIKQLQNLLDNVKKWISNFNIGLDVKLKRIGKGNYYQLVIIDSKTKIEANLPDVGFGVSQILPVIIEGHYAPIGSTLLIEQPEIHLHPMAQAVLGDLFISIINERKALIVETHSEHLISRIRRRIAEGVIKKDDVAIYYFNTTMEGTKIEEVVLNDLGQFEKWPEGFFEEDFQESIAHFNIIAKKKATENG